MSVSHLLILFLGFLVSGEGTCSHGPSKLYS